MVSESEDHQMLFDLIEKMMEFDPTKRLSLDQALRHPFFSCYRKSTTTTTTSSSSSSTKRDWPTERKNLWPTTSSRVLAVTKTFIKVLCLPQFSLSRRAVRLLTVSVHCLAVSCPKTSSSQPLTTVSICGMFDLMNAPSPADVYLFLFVIYHCSHYAYWESSFLLTNCMICLCFHFLFFFSLWRGLSHALIRVSVLQY